MMMLPRFRRASPGRFTLERVAWLLLTFSTRLAVASASRPHSYQNPILPPHIPQGQGHGEHEFVMRASFCSEMVRLLTTLTRLSDIFISGGHTKIRISI
jgi:hypothetical protein